MASGPRFLKLRGRTWYFQIEVPEDVRGSYGGKSKIIQTTGERDLTLAQPIALRLASECKDRFNQQRRSRGLKGSSPREVYSAKRTMLGQGLSEVTFARGDEPEDPEGYAASVEIESLVEGAPKDASGEPVLGSRAQAELDAINDWQRERDGRKVAPRDAYGMTFSDAAKGCMKHKARELRGQSKAQYESTHRLFADFIGDKAIRLVTPKDAAEFIDAVSQFDPSWGRGGGVKKLSFAELQSRFGATGRGLANKTINRYLTALNLVWDWAKARGEASGDNPFNGQFRRLNGKTVRAYTHFADRELDVLFGELPRNRALWEIGMVALYSGMRLNEICSLAWEDIKCEGRVWYFDITEAKSEAGVRVVPVHSKLRWLLRRRNDKARKVPLTGFIWPELKSGGPDGKRSWKFTKDFTVYRRSCAISDHVGTYRKGFHSLRKNATRCLELARVPQNEAAEILGHEKSGITYRVYNPEGLTLRQRRDVVEMIHYPKLAKAKAERQAEEG